MTVRVQSNGFEELSCLSFNEIITIQNTLFVDINNKKNFVFVNHSCEPIAIRDGQIFSIANVTSWHVGQYKKCEHKITVEIDNSEEIIY